MPFKSDAQRRACWAKHYQDLKAGKTPKWNCKEWEKATMIKPRILFLKQDLERYPDDVVSKLAKHHGVDNIFRLAIAIDKKY